MANQFVKLYKDLQSGNYVLVDKDEPILCPFQFIQTVASTTWKISHNRNTFNIIIQIFVNNQFVQPQNVEFDDANNLTLTFSVPIAGIANVGCWTDPSFCTPLPTPTITPTISPTTTPQPTITPTLTATSTPAVTITPSNTQTITPTMTRTVTPTISITPTLSPTPSASTSVTPTLTRTPTFTPTLSPPPSPSPTPSVTVSVTPSTSLTPTISPTTTTTPTVTNTPSITPTITFSPTPSTSLTPTITPTISVTPSLTPTNTPTITPSITITPTITSTVTPTVTPLPSSTPTPSLTQSPTPTVTVTPQPTITRTPTPTVTPSVTPSTSVTTVVGFDQSSYNFSYTNGGTGTVAEVGFQLDSNASSVSKEQGNNFGQNALNQGTWYTGATPAANAYAIMVTLISGGPLSSAMLATTPQPTGTWININTASATVLLWGMQIFSGSRSAVIQAQLRRNSDSTIVSTATINLSVTF